ncbi:MAG: hypothetical protein MUF02_08815 [Acidobacteria bacterium]|nr:hypothetical protein [Acidobacteriota bacterium]
MKKTILFAIMVLVSIVLLGQDQDQPPVQPQDEPQGQTAEPPPTVPVLPEGRDLKTIRFPRAFIHAGKEYPAGKYWMVLGEKDGQAVFFVANAAKEPMFEELAIVKPKVRRGGSGFHVDMSRTKDGEYARIKVTAPNEWTLAYFLFKK